MHKDLELLLCDYQRSTLAKTYQALIDSGEADQLTLWKIRELINYRAAQETASASGTAFIDQFSGTTWLDRQYWSTSESVAA